MKKIFLTKKLPQRISKGHDWIFEHEIAHIEGESVEEDVVHVFTHTGSYLGVGFYNRHSKIAIRILSRQEEHIDFEKLFMKLLSQAILLRKNLQMNDFQILRLFHSESDGLSGLIIDRFGSEISVQVLTQSLENRKSIIQKVIRQTLGQDIRVHFDDSNSLRKYENLTIVSEIETPFTIEDWMYRLEYRSKNSYSIERRDMYKYMGRISANKIVWDLFCGMGHFSLCALKNKALSVLSVDNKKESIQELKELISLNHFDESKITTIQENVFDFLKTMKKDFNKPDVIIIDPPVFNYKDFQLRPYKEIMLQAVRILSVQDMILIGFQSSHIDAHLFENMMDEVASDSKKSFIILKKFQNSPDCPVNRIYEHSDNFHYWLIQLK